MSDDGAHGLSLIAFVGSVFSPYYALARKLNGGVADPENFCALNIALYGKAGKRWTMTERGAGQVSRAADYFQIGPSNIQWHGQELVFICDEIGAPIPRRVRGRVTVQPNGFANFTTSIDNTGLHRWRPIAPCARVQVEFESPKVSWSGHAYMDSNEGDEPIDQAFRQWDWARATMANGDTCVIYDTAPQDGDRRLVAQRFAPSGESFGFETPKKYSLKPSAWRVGRNFYSESIDAPEIISTLEDTPFYVRSLIDTELLGEKLRAVHESLDIPRLVSLPVRLMLPWRMPRRW